MPPFPAPDNVALALLVRRAVQAYQSGEATAEQAILNAAVNAWYKGHVQGEDACPGCDYRGKLNKQSTKGWVEAELNGRNLAALTMAAPCGQGHGGPESTTRDIREVSDMQSQLPAFRDALSYLLAVSSAGSSWLCRPTWLMRVAAIALAWVRLTVARCRFVMPSRAATSLPRRSRAS